MRLTFLCLLLVTSVYSIAQSFYMFVGTYTSKGSKGIYVYKFDASTGKAEWLSNTDSIVNPSYLAIAPDKKHIYAVTETATNNTGSISAFSFDRSTGKLTFINKQYSGGANPCYVSVHNTNKWVVTGNYTGGNLSAFAVNADGRLQPLSQLIQHTGAGVNKQRQEKAHVHSTVFSPDQKYLFTPDLGEDKVYIYNFNAASAKPLTPASPAFKASEPGSGPRHFTFHPNNKFAYLIEEMSGTVVAHKYNNGKLTSIQRIITHPSDFKGDIGSADIHVSPDGKFLYASNRGEENTITIFSIDKNSGKLTLKGYQSTMGQTPRNFNIDPSGNYLLVANQATDNIVIFKRDKQTGLLHETGEQIKVPTPVCIQMMK
ncbi:MAG: lactonase family protein [Segetibacter sp.]|nr:lactonase family protein [Segetibacter sp.]